MPMPKIDMVKVANSSNIEEVLYNEETGKFYAKFKGGAVYRYDNVPVEEGRIIQATAGMDEISTGHWINRLIKKGGYKYTKLGS
jgi:KTSC domain